jgi:hypothetical protein
MMRFDWRKEKDSRLNRINPFGSSGLGKQHSQPPVEAMVTLAQAPSCFLDGIFPAAQIRVFPDFSQREKLPPS